MANRIPDRENIKEDIIAKRGYFVKNDNNKLAYMCVDFEGEPAYKNIKGAWQSNATYAVIHRLAISKQNVGSGLSNVIIQLVEKLCKQKGVDSIRVDTDNANKIMQHILQKIVLYIVAQYGLKVVTNSLLKNISIIQISFRMYNISFTEILQSVFRRAILKSKKIKKYCAISIRKGRKYGICKKNMGGN